MPYERKAEAKTLNIPLYMLFVLGKELEVENYNLEWATVFVKLSPFSFKYEKKVTGNRAIITKCWENGVFFGKKFGGFMDNA